MVGKAWVIACDHVLDLLLGQGGENGETADTDTERSPHADLERKSLDRERSFMPVETHAVEPAALGEKHGVSGRFGDAGERRVADLAQIETRSGGQSQLEYHRTEIVAVRVGVLMHHAFRDQTLQHAVHRGALQPGAR